MNRKLDLVQQQYNNAFSFISCGTNIHFDESVLENTFCEIRDTVDEIYVESDIIFKNGANLDLLMSIYESVQSVVNQFDDKLQAVLMMKMDVLATILGSRIMFAPKKIKTLRYNVDAECVSIEFSGLFFEEALPDGPWEPSAKNYTVGGDWIKWYRLHLYK
jgi:hypothetical protein